MTQLALPVGLTDHALFENFVVGCNGAALAAVRSQAQRRRHPVMWLWGPAGSGRSHLLQAACAAAGPDARYLPLKRVVEAAPPVLAETAVRPSLVCLDDIDRAAGKDDWESALFAWFNTLTESGGALLVSAGSAPRQVAFALPDLRSRMTSGPVFQLQLLTDEERIDALKLRASRRGLTLPDEVGVYLLRHFRRDMATQYALLDRLDKASLAAQRRLTVPFVRQVLNSD